MLISESQRSRAWANARERALQLLGFDPDEPRDEGGKWTDGGGDGAAGALASYPPPSDADIEALLTPKPAKKSAAELFADWLDTRVRASARQLLGRK